MKCFLSNQFSRNGFSELKGGKLGKSGANEVLDERQWEERKGIIV